MNTKPLAVAAMVALLAGCATSHLKRPLPDYTGPDAATLYIQRPPGGLGAWGTIPVALDGTPLGALGVGEYWELRLRPGMHNVSENTGGIGVRMKPGSVHCVVIGLWMDGTYIHPAQHCPPPKGWKLAAKSGAN